MKAIDAVRDAPLTQPTDKGGNHPLWVAGHLALTEAMFREMISGQSNPLDRAADTDHRDEALQPHS